MEGSVLNGQIYRGNTSNALEIGHVTLEKRWSKTVIVEIVDV